MYITAVHVTKETLLSFRFSQLVKIGPTRTIPCKGRQLQTNTNLEKLTRFNSIQKPNFQNYSCGYALKAKAAHG